MIATVPTAIAIEDGSRVRLRVLNEEPADVGDEEPAELLDVERPRTRGACIDGPRPCPWVGCRHHLFLEVSDAGTIRPNIPGEPGDMAPEHSCSLDAADRGDLTLSEIGDPLRGVTRERIRQIGVVALRKVGLRGGARLAELGGHVRAPLDLFDDEHEASSSR